MRKVCLAAILTLLLEACGGQIRGVVYLDGNGNGSPDPDEKTLTHVAVQVTKDNQPMAHLRTDSEGVFVSPVDRTGYYCVEVEEPALQQNLMAQFRSGAIPRRAIPSINSSISLGPSIKTMKQTLNPIPSSGAGESSDATPKEEEKDPDAKKEKELLPSQTRLDTGAAIPASKTESGKTCHYLKSRNLTADVPVQLDYAGEMERIPAPTVKQQNDFEAFQMVIQHPFGCFLRPMIFPDALEVLWPRDAAKQDPSIAFIDETGSRVEFTDRFLAASVGLYLRPRDDIPFGKQTIEIKPEAICPDGGAFVLPTHTIHLNMEPQISVSQQIAPRVPEGGALDWSVTLHNRTGRRTTVKLIAEYPTADAAVSPVEGMDCVISGDHLECPSILLETDAEESVSFQVRFDNISENRAVPVLFKAKGVVAGIDEEEFEMKATDARVMIDPVN